MNPKAIENKQARVSRCNITNRDELIEKHIKSIAKRRKLRSGYAITSIEEI